ncbi:21080_t:CDS:2, partial [Cetraspora pellucida]
QLPSSIFEFATALLQSLKSRFPNTNLYNAMKIFELSLLPRKDCDLSNYGNAEIEILKITRVYGNCVSGFNDPDINDYTFCLENEHGKVIYDLSENIHKRVKVVSPGITPYQENFKNGIMKPDTIVNLRFVIRCNGKKIGDGLVKYL